MPSIRHCLPLDPTNHPLAPPAPTLEHLFAHASALARVALAGPTDPSLAFLLLCDLLQAKNMFYLSLNSGFS